MQKAIPRVWLAAWTLLILAVPAASVICFAWEPAVAPTESSATDPEKVAPAPHDGGHLREGTELKDVSGTFRLVDGRLLFSTAKNRYVTLENLNLERVARLVDNLAETGTWSVSGSVTEFQGTNFLLIRRALLKSQRSPAGL